jgi:acetyl-CoA carboxylase carboxyltransferase component
VPQISVILGSCAGGAVYSPALTDFVFMVKDISLMFVTGPDVIKTVTGEEVTKEMLGSADLHASQTGAAHFVANSEEECMKMVRKLLSYLPLNSLEQPPRLHMGDRVDRTDDALRHVVPVNSAKSYDVLRIIRKIIDQGDFLEVHARFARNICIGFARMDGETVGIIANQPIHMAGCLDINASVKAARFIRFCDAFNIPLLTFVDCPGYLPGTQQEQGAIIRHGAKLLYAYAEATVPKLTIVVRKAYGGAYSAMCAQGLGADFIVALPTAEFGVMGPEATVNLLFANEVAQAENPETRREELIGVLRERYSHPYGPAAVGIINDIIDPSVLRPHLINHLNTYRNVKRTLPPKKHGNIPL